MAKIHSFSKSLADSHRDSQDPLWRVIYYSFWPGYDDAQTFDDMIMQKAGVDDGIRWNGKTILIDRKVRFPRTNKHGTAVIYHDIALEYFSDEDARKPGWIVKETKADYWIYLNRMNDTVHLIPVKPGRNAWKKYKDKWIKAYPFQIRAYNKEHGHSWKTLSYGIPVNVFSEACQEFGEKIKSRSIKKKVPNG